MSHSPSSSTSSSEGDRTPSLSPPIKSKMVSFQDKGYVMLHGTNAAPSTAINDDLEVTSRRRRGKRLVNRDNGRTNISNVGTTSRNWFGLFTDSFTTIVNFPWYTISAVFGGTYLMSWIFFACLWLAVARYDKSINGTCLSGTEKGIDNFSGALFFSIETQLTIGYGNVYISNDCSSGLVVLIVQCVMGLVLDAVLLGLLFTKISRPRSRRKTILFSDRAVMCEKDGEYCIEFRIGNLRKSQIAECHVRLVLYWYQEVEGRGVFQQHDLECGYDTGEDRVVLLTPANIQHRVNKDSPLHGLTPASLRDQDLEIVVVLEGVIEATGLTLQALWSYTAQEVVGGEGLRSIVSRRDGGNWIVDFRRFNEVITHDSEV